MKTNFLHLLIVSGVVAACSVSHPPKTMGALFTDDFTSGASPLWSNLRGNWIATGGVYNAQAPSTTPPTYSGLPYVMGDFTFDIDINKVADGGLWLHSDAAGQNGVLLIIGGHGFAGGNRGGAGKSMYFHVVQNGAIGPIVNEVTNVFSNPGVQNTHVHVAVTGNVYSATAEGKTASFTTSLFPTGQVALFDYYGDQTYDNVVLNVPEPTSLATFSSLSLLLLCRRKRKDAEVAAAGF